MKNAFEYEAELKGLREELRISNEYCDSEQALMQSKLTAAEHRNAVLVQHLEGLKHRCEIFIRGDDGRGMNVDGIRYTLVLVNSALKTTKSGETE